MILDSLDNLQKYASLNPGFRAAQDFLRKTDLASLAAGKHEIDGDRMFVMLNRGTGRGREAAKLEVHRRYIDVQYAVSGTDEIGWRPLSTCGTPDAPFDVDGDWALYSDRPLVWVPVPPGNYAIFFPADAHAPMTAQTELVKAVVKVAVDWS